MRPTIRLAQVAHARSGDKGNHANIGVVAYTPSGYEWLCEQLTPERVADYFASLGCSHVERFELPGIGALNFLLHDALAGGASMSLRTDTQGKLLAQAISDLELPKPAGLAHMLRGAPPPAEQPTETAEPLDEFGFAGFDAAAAAHDPAESHDLAETGEYAESQGFEALHYEGSPASGNADDFADLGAPAQSDTLPADDGSAQAGQATSEHDAEDAADFLRDFESSTGDSSGSPSSPDKSGTSSTDDDDEWDIFKQ